MAIHRAYSNDSAPWNSTPPPTRRDCLYCWPLARWCESFEKHEDFLKRASRTTAVSTVATWAAWSGVKETSPWPIWKSSSLLFNSSLRNSLQLWMTIFRINSHMDKSFNFGLFQNALKYISNEESSPINKNFNHQKFIQVSIRYLP